MFRRYHESSLSVVALKHKSKAPFLEGWSKFSHELPSDELIDSWEDNYKKNGWGIGLVLGPCSGIMALDIDTDNADTLRTAPRSPVVKRGKKGETRFFKFNAQIPSLKLKEYGVEVLSTGNQTVLPPSIHPETLLPYEWKTQLTLLDIEAKDLPELMMSDLELMPKINSSHIAGEQSSGRNNVLKAIVSAMRGRGELELNIVNEIYNYDKEHHTPRLFLDSSENFPGSTEEEAKLNALLFCSRVTQSLVRLKAVQFPIETSNCDIRIDFDSFNNSKIQSFQYKAPPALSGFLSAYSSVAVAASRSDVNMISLGGALSILAGICSNRFRVGSTWPNLYILNVAGSGFGKNLPNELTKLLLADTGILGAANYKSGASMYTSLHLQQERVDVIDEATMLFKSMRAGDSWQSEMQEILCTLFSCSSSLFTGVSVKSALQDKSSGGRDGACYNPCINLLTSTTPQGFRESFDRSMASKGLLPRFLVFNQHNPGDWKEFKGLMNFEREIISLKEFIADILRIDKRVLIDTENVEENLVGPRMGKKYDPIDFPMDPNARKLLRDLDKACFDKAKLDESEEYGPFYNRFCELSIKLSLLIAVSECKTSIDVDCVSRAIDIVEMQHHNSKLLLGSLTDPKATRAESSTQRAITLVQKHGSMRTSALLRHFRGLSDRHQRDMISALLSSGLIAQEQKKSGSVLLYVGDQADSLN